MKWQAGAVAQPQIEPDAEPALRETQATGFVSNLYVKAEPGDEEWQERVLVPIEEL